MGGHLPCCTWPRSVGRIRVVVGQRQASGVSVVSPRFGQQPARLASTRIRTRTAGVNCRYAMGNCNGNGPGICGILRNREGRWEGKKLLERAWEALWAAGFEESAARRYLAWMLDYIVFHGKRHPQEMGVPEVRAFLAEDRFSGPAGAQRVEAAAAIRFLYEVVLERRWPRRVGRNSRQQRTRSRAGSRKPCISMAVSQA